MAHTEDFKKAALNHAKKIGSIPQAAKDFGVDTRTMYRWNDEYHICPIQQMRTFTDEQKREILTYANQHGLTSAMREFDVDIATQLSWNRTLHIYKTTGRHERTTHAKQYQRFSKEEKLEILCFVRDYGISKAVRKYNIAPSTIQFWNATYKIYQQRRHRTFTSKQKQEIVKYATDTSVVDAAQKFNLYHHQIQRWIDDSVSFEQ